jgi:hypothetical protein
MELQTSQEDLANKERLLKELEASVAGQRQDVEPFDGRTGSQECTAGGDGKMLNEKDRVLDELRERVAEALLGFEGQGLSVTRRMGKCMCPWMKNCFFNREAPWWIPTG